LLRVYVLISVHGPVRYEVENLTAFPKEWGRPTDAKTEIISKSGSSIYKPS